MVVRNGSFQTCCLNSLMIGLIWATFLLGNVIFIMALHPVSIFFTFGYIFMSKKSHLLSFQPPLSKNHKNRPKFTIFFFFSQGWGIKSVPIYCQITFYKSETLEEHQLYNKPWFHGGIRSLYFQAFTANRIIVSYLRLHLLIWGYLLKNDG